MSEQTNISDVEMREIGFEVGAMADMHVHLRIGDGIIASLIMAAIAGGVYALGPQPNVGDGLVTAEQVIGYRENVIRLVPNGQQMEFRFFLMITEDTTKEDIDRCIAAGIFDGKILPFLRTTKAQSGVKGYLRLLTNIRYCGEVGMRVHIHPEHPSLLFGNRDAEFVFLPIVHEFLRETETTIFWEHGTDGRCIPHWKEFAKSGRFFVTLTAHHLMTNEDHTFGDVRAVCKPPIKTEQDRLELVRLVMEDHSWVIAASDSAYHSDKRKQPDHGRCDCGALTEPWIVPFYAHALDDLLRRPGGIQIFENFTSRNAQRAFNLPPAPCKIKLVREPQIISKTYPVGDEIGLPFWAGQGIRYRIKS